MASSGWRGRRVAGGAAFALLVMIGAATAGGSLPPDPASAETAAVENESAILGDWRLAAIDGEPVPEGVSPTISFAAGGKVSGNAGCNRYFGGFTLKDGALSFGALGTTRKACAKPVMAVESKVLRHLEKTAAARIDGSGQLVLDAGGGELVFTR